MMPNKRLLGLVPEAGKYIFQKVVFSWMSLLAGIVLWFAVGTQLQNLKDGGGVLPVTFMAAFACVIIRFLLTRSITDVTHKTVSCVKAKLRRDIYAKIRRLGTGYTME